jgi:hypothetical protein
VPRPCHGLNHDRLPPAVEDRRVVDVADLLVDRDQRGHQSRELAEVELLLSVGQRRVGIRMDLDHHAIGADRDATHRERRHEPALAGRVARIDDDQQVAQAVEHRHGREVHRVAHRRLERPDPALAQDHVRIARRRCTRA